MNTITRTRLLHQLSYTLSDDDIRFGWTLNLDPANHVYNISFTQRPSLVGCKVKILYQPLQVSPRKRFRPTTYPQKP